MIRGQAAKLSRRTFIVGSAAAGGGLALGFNLPSGSALAQSAAGDGTEVNVWVVIKPDDTCVIRIARSEMGQGTLTGLAQLVAEELECDWNKVTTEQITPGANLARKRVWGEMGTGGSRGIRTSQDYVRRGGAAARMMLLQAAAEEWKVPVGELTVADGVITHAASGRSTSYGKVAAAAAKLDPPDPKSIKLKDPKDWKIAGKPMKRLDTADKLNGSKSLCHRRQAAGHAVRRDQGVPGVRRQAEELRRGEDRGHARRPQGREGEGHRRRGRCRYLVAGEDRARRAADRLGRGRQRIPVERDHRRAPQGGAHRGRHQRRPSQRRRAEGDRGRGQEGRGGLQHAVPRPCVHGADERHGQDLGRQGRGVGAEPERGGVACRPVGGLRRSARQLRGLPPRPRRRLRPARRHAGLRPPGGGDRQEFPRRPDQADLEPRGGPGARLLPADLAVPAVRRPRRRAATWSDCTSACPGNRSTPP